MEDAKQIVPAQASGQQVQLTGTQLKVSGWSCQQQDVVLAAAAAEQRGQDLTDWFSTIIRIGGGSRCRRHRGRHRSC